MILNPVNIHDVKHDFKSITSCFQTSCFITIIIKHDVMKWNNKNNKK